MSEITNFEKIAESPVPEANVPYEESSIVTTRVFGRNHTLGDFEANIEQFLLVWAKSGLPLQLLSQPDFPHLDRLYEIVDNFRAENSNLSTIHIDLAPNNNPEISFAMLNMCRLRALSLGLPSYITNSTDIYPTPELYRTLSELINLHPSILGTGVFLDGVHSRQLLDKVRRNPNSLYDLVWLLTHNNALNATKTVMYPVRSENGGLVTVLDIYSHLTDNRGVNSKWANKTLIGADGAEHKIGGNEDSERLLRILLADLLYPKYYQVPLAPVIFNVFPLMQREGKEVLGYPAKLARRKEVVNYYLDHYKSKLGLNPQIVDQRVQEFVQNGIYWVTPHQDGTYTLYRPALGQSLSSRTKDQIKEFLDIEQQRRLDQILTFER